MALITRRRLGRARWTTLRQICPRSVERSGGGDLRPLAKESQELLSVLFEGLPDRLDHHPPGMRLKKPLDDQLLEHFIDRGDLTQDETRMLLTDSHVKPLRKET